MKAIFLFIGPSDMEDIEKHLREELTKSQPPGYSVEEALGMRLSLGTAFAQDGALTPQKVPTAPTGPTAWRQKP